MKLDWVAHSKRHCKHLHKSVWSDWTLHPCIRVLPSGGKRVKTGTKSLGGQGCYGKKKNTEKLCGFLCKFLLRPSSRHCKKYLFWQFHPHPFLFFFHLSILFPRSHFKWKKIRKTTFSYLDKGSFRSKDFRSTQILFFILLVFRSRVSMIWWICAFFFHKWDVRWKDGRKIVVLIVFFGRI